MALLLIMIYLLLACTPASSRGPALEERREPNSALQEGCAQQTARKLEIFQEALAEGWRSYETLCQRLGAPDWETGSGQMILIYELADGSEVWLSYAGLHDLAGAQWRDDGQSVDLLAAP